MFKKVQTVQFTCDCCGAKAIAYEEIGRPKPDNWTTKTITLKKSKHDPDFDWWVGFQYEDYCEKCSLLTPEQIEKQKEIIEASVDIKN